MPKAEIDKIREYVRDVWPEKRRGDIEENVEWLVSNKYTTLNAVKEIKSDNHLILYGGKLPMRFRVLIQYNNQ